MLLLQTAEVLLAAVGVDLLLCKVVGAAAGDDEGAPPDPVGSLVVSFFFFFVYFCLSLGGGELEVVDGYVG